MSLMVDKGVQCSNEVDYNGNGGSLEFWRLANEIKQSSGRAQCYSVTFSRNYIDLRADLDLLPEPMVTPERLLAIEDEHTPDLFTEQFNDEATAEDCEEVIDIVEAMFEDDTELDMAIIAQVLDGTIDINIAAQVFRSLPFASKFELHGQTLYKRPHRQKGHV